MYNFAFTKGTEPSRAHTHLKPNGWNRKRYWNFSWHEIGVFDVTAMIDHILKETDQEKVTYIGFSQGTTTFLVMTSMRPEYNAKLLDIHLLAPVSSLRNMRNISLKTLAKFYKPLKKLAEMLRIYYLTGNKIWPWKAFELAYRSSKKFESDPNNITLDTFLDAVIHSKLLQCIASFHYNLNVALFLSNH